MTDMSLSGETITDVNGEYQVSIRTANGWILTIEGDIVCATPDGQAHHLAGDEPGSAEALAPLLTGATIESMSLNETDGLRLALTGGNVVEVAPDEDFEAFSIVGPQQQRTISTPGGKLATWANTNE